MKFLERIYLHIVPPEIKHIYNAILEKDDSWKAYNYEGQCTNTKLKFSLNERRDSNLKQSYKVSIEINPESMSPIKEIRVRKGRSTIFSPSGYLLKKACKRRKKLIDTDKILII